MTTTIGKGAAFAFRKTITVAEQAMFTGISGNLGGLYVDVTKARALGAPAAVGFELIAAAMATTSLNRLAGPEYRIGKMDLNFPVPVYVGQSVEARAEVDAADAAGIICNVTCRTVPEGTVVAIGAATLVPFRAGA
ncbi:acyl dehydratase [Sinirhodobacter populi]|uniref:Acyl dehydratase n=1 Tax=Paenirhodobacter populi TaxID=2306993 RepID=A0A443K349_9RHOB|nr:MaoC family dehydratase [Sinirhodobacter populi]RWR27172.1 acyl dehydratase [Sinirhodobacter populi]